MIALEDLRSMPEARLLEEAEQILQSGAGDQFIIFKLAMMLKNRWKRFGYARKLLWLARSESKKLSHVQTTLKFRLKLAQQHALCTAKDNDLPPFERFERALKILRERDLEGENDPSAAISQETLGIAGGICKSRWEAFGQRTDLERALAYYERGWKQGAGDDGYTGINTAYLLDLLAFQEQKQATKIAGESQAAKQRREEAKGIREALLKTLPDLAAQVKAAHESESESAKKEEAADRLYWILVTLGEACLGLGPQDNAQYETARMFYAAARELNRDDWMVETTARQAASLVRLSQTDGAGAMAKGSAAWAAVAALVGDDAPGLESAFLGKVGLALSGGGFRASLFHIGVLARLAELDMLRHVEYLSCVSGGSIIGAYYYLELRKLLSEKTEGELGPQDYVNLVDRIEKRFLEGVQKNLRMRALSDFKTNFEHNMGSGILPTEYVAQLYEELLFANIEEPAPGGQPVPQPARRSMPDLCIYPRVRTNGQLGNDHNFRPKDNNWRRAHKVPILILNATTLNTGHNWQFTTSWMGEPPATINNEVDANLRLRRMYYHQAPQAPQDLEGKLGRDYYRRFNLGRAVGASACVPVLFEPVHMPGLYEDIVTVHLVDGGVHDNQGISSLLEQGCTTLLVSDGSGQLGDESDPGFALATSAFRTDEIVQERVRVAQYQDLASRLRSGLLRGLMFLHLKKEVELPPRDWVGCLDPYEASEDAKQAAEKTTSTSYRVHREIQRALSRVRTDLDAFHDAEAFALMADGYLMTAWCFPEELSTTIGPAKIEHTWRFLSVATAMGTADPRLMRLLKQSSEKLFKVWNLDARLKKLRTAFMVGMGAIALVLLIYGYLRQPPWVLLTTRSLSRWILSLLLVAVGTALVGKTVMRYINFPGTLRDLLIRAGTAFFMARVANFHLRVMDPLYLKAGRIAADEATNRAAATRAGQ